MSDVTRLLNAANQGNRQAAAECCPWFMMSCASWPRHGWREAGPDARRHGAGARGVPAAGGRADVRGSAAFLRRRGRGDPAHPRRAGARRRQALKDAAVRGTGKNSIPAASLAGP